jgi:hypothetical protein
MVLFTIKFEIFSSLTENPRLLAKPGAKDTEISLKKHHARRRFAASNPKPPNPINARVVGSGTETVPIAAKT